MTLARPRREQEQEIRAPSGEDTECRSFGSNRKSMPGSADIDSAPAAIVALPASTTIHARSFTWWSPRR